MIDQQDFIPRTLSTHWLGGLKTDTFDSAVEAAGKWIDENGIDVINIETIVLPIGSDDVTENPAIEGFPAMSRQFIRVWYRK
jgi:hypothetical protein